MIICTFEDRGKSSLRHVVVGCLVLSKSKDRILLIKRALNVSSRPNKYAFPGGYMDRDEDTKQTALRELKEETGYEGRIIELFRIKDNPDRPHEDRQNVDFIYLVEVLNKVGEHDDEIAEVKWFGLNQVPLESEWAFDHFEDLQLYKKHQKKPFNLPIIGKNRL